MGEELKNKVAIITGSYGDIGNAIAENLIASGTKIATLSLFSEKSYL